MFLQNKQAFTDTPAGFRREIIKYSAYEGDTTPMLWTIAALLLLLWLVGLVGNYTLGGLIHVLLLLAAVVVILRLVQGRSII